MSVQLAVAGWGLFIAENWILSENRTSIIEWLEDDAEESKYHALYGNACPCTPEQPDTHSLTCSTLHHYPESQARALRWQR